MSASRGLGGSPSGHTAEAARSARRTRRSRTETPSRRESRATCGRRRPRRRRACGHVEAHRAQLLDRVDDERDVPLPAGARDRLDVDAVSRCPDDRAQHDRARPCVDRLDDARRRQPSPSPSTTRRTPSPARHRSWKGATTEMKSSSDTTTFSPARRRSHRDRVDRLVDALEAIRAAGADQPRRGRTRSSSRPRGAPRVVSSRPRRGRPRPAAWAGSATSPIPAASRCTSFCVRGKDGGLQLHPAHHQWCSIFARKARVRGLRAALKSA